MKVIETVIKNGITEKENKFKYLRVFVTRENGKEKSSLASDNAYFYSVRKLLSWRLISRKLKLKIYRMVILPVKLHDCDRWRTTVR